MLRAVNTASTDGTSVLLLLVQALYGVILSQKYGNLPLKAPTS